jgi:hypothetical protein
VRKSLFYTRMTFSFRRFFPLRHCCYSFLQATELFGNPKLQVLLLKKLTKCQQRYISDKTGPMIAVHESRRIARFDCPKWSKCLAPHEIGPLRQSDSNAASKGNESFVDQQRGNLARCPASEILSLMGAATHAGDKAKLLSAP